MVKEAEKAPLFITATSARERSRTRRFRETQGNLVSWRARQMKKKYDNTVELIGRDFVKSENGVCTIGEYAFSTEADRADA